MVRSPALVALVTLLAAGCAPTDAPASAPASPTSRSDRYAASACGLVARAIDEQDLHFTTSMEAGRRALDSADPGLREPGHRLLLAGKDAGDLFVKNEPGTVDMGPANARLAEAQRGLLSACTDRFGARPWAFE